MLTCPECHLCWSEPADGQDRCTYCAVPLVRATRGTGYTMDPIAARAFIRRQTGEYLLLGITSMTPKQRERMEALDVISPGRKQWAIAVLDASSRAHGVPPHQRTGRHRRLNLNSGEIEHSVRAPA